ncbi:hypothetical protein WMF37_47185 [Sorangium sp. So ce291]|uniref:hypothetical protein n=1 Tax=Sorangium sp. So ce291 TaxID=3133294 RepID=UPI003F5EE7AB
MLHRVLLSTSLLVLFGSLAAGCQSAPAGAPTAPPPVEGGRGAEAEEALSLDDAGGGGAPTGAGGATGTGEPQGCGTDSPLLKYVGHSQDACARIRFACEPGWSYFSDDCGCGCTKQP